MSKQTRRTPRPGGPPAVAKTPTAATPAAPIKPPSQATRETIESLVVAFVLAFLFRTFQAEPFVIPTGSMAPTLMGQHIDVNCPQCGERRQASCSEYADAAQRSGPNAAASDVMAGMCPSCRYVMPFRGDGLPRSTPETAQEIAQQPPRPGDRILVNKYAYAFTDPKRWDVIVFHFPGDARTNYIKRLVGLPGETIQIRGGDVYVAAGPDAPLEIARKSDPQLLAMRQLVHDTDHNASALHKAGWPLAWRGAAGDWDVKTAGEPTAVMQTASAAAPGDAPAWLRFFHTPAPASAWRAVREAQARGEQGFALDPASLQAVPPSLVSDFTAYNARELRGMPGGREMVPQTLAGFGDLNVSPLKQGLHWVGDLMVETTLTVDGGALLLDLVEAGQHFRCEIDSATGDAQVSIRQFESDEPLPNVKFTGETPLRAGAEAQVRFANFDDQVALWINGDRVPLTDDGIYDAAEVFAAAGATTPQASPRDAGDLSPAGIGVRGGGVTIDQIALYRDNYYIATNHLEHYTGQQFSFQQPLSDYPTDTLRGLTARNGLDRLMSEPALWGAFDQRRAVEFKLTDFEDDSTDQYFVLGDNSAESQDCRLWLVGGAAGNRPGGHYVERKLLIGKAALVYWPHALVKLPGTPLPLVPNFGDMRMIR